tara:strand:+ start:254 stop:523 length:270 start_codon:yes stop_codon:yes gene_type:complete
MTNQEINNTFKTFKSFQVKASRKSMDTIYASLRMWGLKPDCLQYDEHREDMILFQWNDCKPETYFGIWRWEKGWSNTAVIKTICNEYNK